MPVRFSQVLSVCLHVAVVFAMIHLAAVQQTPLNRKQAPTSWSSTKLVWHLPKAEPGTGGGGGGQMALPATRGHLPLQTPRPFVAPTTIRPEQMPDLPVEPALAGPVATVAPIGQLGLPDAPIGPPSDGRGRRGGIGDGEDDGVGDKSGPKGPGGNVTGRGWTGSSTQPVLIFKIEPEFSEEARRARLEGIVVIEGEIDELGRVQNLKVKHGLGLGLDEQAIEAVKKWRFRPGTQNGKPVRKRVLIEVTFHLL